VEVAFHHILYLRKVYPSELFEQRKKYNVPIFASRHPLLSNYISDVIFQSMAEISNGLVSKLILAIQDATTFPRKTLEHFAFDLQYLVDPATTFQNVADRDIRQERTSSGTIVDAEVHLRGFLIRLNNSSQTHLNELPQNELTWTTFLELNNPALEPGKSSRHNTFSDFSPQWTPAPDPMESKRLENLALEHGNQSSYPIENVKKRLWPLKSQTVGMIQLQMLVIEHIDEIRDKSKQTVTVESIKNKGKEKA
ncbi:DNA-binding protein, partial [Phakopsora pachyrhizi]